MEIARPKPSSLLDTRPSLLVAIDAIFHLLQPRHERIFELVGLTNDLEDVRTRLARLALGSPREDAAETLEAFVNELHLILASEESFSTSLDNITTIDKEWGGCFRMLLMACLDLLLLPNWSGDGDFRKFHTCVLQTLLPISTKTWLSLNEAKIGCFQFDLPQHLWRVVSEITINNTASLGMAVSILARSLRLFQPWMEAERPNVKLFEAVNYDLRAQDYFISLIRHGLLDNDGATRKQSLYILKQTVKFCTFYMQPESDAPEGSDERRVFFWKPTDRESWSQTWKRFFLLYESIQETQVHIVEPMLPLLRSLITDVENQLDRSWWEIIIHRAIEGDSGSVRAVILQAVLEMDAGKIPRLMEARDLLFGTLLRAVDSTALFQTGIDDGTMVVSPFGMAVAQFYANYLMAINVESRSQELELFLHRVTEQVRSATPALFLLQTLLQLPAQPLLRAKGISLLCSFSRNTVLFHNLNARKLARWQLLYAFLRLADAASLSFVEIATALYEFLRDNNQFTSDGKEYRDICAWLSHNFEDDYVDQNISLSVQEYFVAAMNGELVQTKAAELSTMLLFSLSRKDGFAQSIRPLYQQMAVIARVDTEPAYIIAGVTLFATLDAKIRSVTEGKTDLLSSMDVGARLYAWIAAVEQLLLRDSLEMLPSLPAAMTLLSGMRLFFAKAAEEPNALITYLNMLLYRLVEMANCFAKQAAMERAESYLLQLQKMIVFELMSISLGTLERIGTFHLGFRDSENLENVFSCELEKPPRMTDEQADDWDALLIAFSVSRWTLIAVIARFSRNSPDMTDLVNIDEMFLKCLLALESAQYKSVIAIFDCLRILASLTNELSPSSIAQAINVSKLVLQESAATPIWLYLYTEAFIDFFFQPALLCREDVGGDMDSLVAHVLDYLLHDLGRVRRNLITRLARNLHAFWGSPLGRASRLALLPYFTELLLYGPVREESEDRLAQALARSHTTDRNLEERGAAADAVAASSDYLVRVSMNSVILHLDPAEAQDRQFALTLFDDLLDSVAVYSN